MSGPDAAPFITVKVTGKECTCGHYLKSQHDGQGCMFCMDCKKKGTSR